jgi:hypothetical protein
MLSQPRSADWGWMLGEAHDRVHSSVVAGSCSFFFIFFFGRAVFYISSKGLKKMVRYGRWDVAPCPVSRALRPWKGIQAERWVCQTSVRREPVQLPEQKYGYHGTSCWTPNRACQTVLNDDEINCQNDEVAPKPAMMTTDFSSLINQLISRDQPSFYRLPSSQPQKGKDLAMVRNRQQIESALDRCCHGRRPLPTWRSVQNGPCQCWTS